MDLLATSATVLPIVCTGLFAGVHLCIRYSAYPAMIALDDTSALRYFTQFYPPLATLQPALIGVAALASTLRLTLTNVSSLAANLHFLVIVHMLYILGYTFGVMLDDNNKMLALGKTDSKWEESKQKGEVRTMLRDWGSRNEARVWPGLVLFVLLVAAETGKL